MYTKKTEFGRVKMPGSGGGLVAKSCPTLCDAMDCSPPGALSVGFSRQEYWSGLPFPSPGDLPGSETEPVSPVSAGGFFTTQPPGNSTYN